MTAKGRRGSDGVTIVEAAFALPILFTFIFGLVDLGMWTLNANQATNAARDGARLAILDYAGADVSSPASPTYSAVVKAAKARLESDKVEDVAVSCTTPAGATVACSAARVDVDSVRVDVRWRWRLVTPVAAILGYDRGDATGSATMRIVGRPLPPPTTTTTTQPPTTTTTAPLNPCAVTLLKLEEPGGGVKRRKIGADFTGQLADPIPVTFTTNGANGCTNLRVQLLSTDGKIKEIACGCDLTPPNPPNYRWSYDGSDNIWFNAGDAYARVLNGTTALAEYKFNVK